MSLAEYLETLRQKLEAEGRFVEAEQADAEKHEQTTAERIKAAHKRAVAILPVLHLRWLDGFLDQLEMMDVPTSRYLDTLQNEWSFTPPWGGDLTVPRLVLLAGPSGSGKTAALCWAGMYALENERKTAYLRASKIPELVQDRRLSELERADVLLLDDLQALADMGGWKRRVLDLVDLYYSDPERVIVAAGQAELPDASDRLRRIIGDEIYSRLTDTNFGGLLIEEARNFRQKGDPEWNLLVSP